jgi:hypothetical protein
MAYSDSVATNDRAMSALTKLLHRDPAKFKRAWYGVFPVATPPAGEITDAQWTQLLRDYGLGDREIYVFLRDLRGRVW